MFEKATRAAAWRALASLTLTVSCAGALLAQDAEPPKPGPAPINDTSIPWDQALKDSLAHPLAKVVLGLIVVLTIVRIVFALRDSARRAAHTGGEGFLGKYYAKKELERLLKGAFFEQAAELVLTLGAHGPPTPGDPQRELEAAELFLKAKRFQRAAEIFVKKGKLKRGGEAYERAQQAELAAELFEKAGELDRAEENFLRSKNKSAIALMWAKAGNSEKAAAYFAEISRPKDAAEHLEKLGRREEALARYLEAYAMASTAASMVRDRRSGERVIGADHESEELFGRVCRLYAELDDTENFAQFLTKNHRPEAAAEVKAGNLERAAELLRGGSKAEPPRPREAGTPGARPRPERAEAGTPGARPRPERAEVANAPEPPAEAGDPRAAAENFEKLGQPAKAADLYAKLGDYARAGALYEAAMQWQGAVFCYEQTGEPAKVAVCWEHLGNHFFSGVAYFTAHDTARAIGCLEKVAKDGSDRKEAARLLGILLHESNRDKEALAYFEEGFGRKIENDDVEAFYYYAQTLERIPSEHPKALSAYQTILKLRPAYRDTEKRAAALKAGTPLPKTSIYRDGQDDPGSLFHTSRFSLRSGSERHRPQPRIS